MLVGPTAPRPSPVFAFAAAQLQLRGGFVATGSFVLGGVFFVVDLMPKIYQKKNRKVKKNHKHLSNGNQMP